jgi:hypothetical protein
MADHPPATSAESTPTRPSAILLAWALVFAAALTLYAATASRGAQWQDGGTHIQRIFSGNLVNPLGLALSHPLHYWLGRLAVSLHPSNPALAITLVSSFAAALTIANLFGLAATLSRSMSAALFAGACLAVAHTFWQMATIAECYTLLTATLSAELWCLIVFLRSRRPAYLWLAFALNGLGLADHNAALLTAPILATILLIFIARRALPWRHFFVCVGVWFVVSLPYTGLIIAELARNSDWPGVIRSALFGHAYSEEVLNLSFSLRRAVVSASFIALNFPNLTLALAVLGMFRARALPAAMCRVLYAALLIHFLFVIRYPVVDQHTFFLPTYLLVTVFAGIGFAQLARETSRGAKLLVRAAVVLLITTPLVYALVPSVARRFNVLAGYARNKPFRDDYNYIFIPWGFANNSAQRLGRRMLDLAGERALLIIPDTSAAPAVWYEARMAGKEGVNVTSLFDTEQVAHAVQTGGRVIFMPSLVMKEPKPVPGSAWRQEGDLYFLEANKAGAGDAP